MVENADDETSRAAEMMRVVRRIASMNLPVAPWPEMKADIEAA